ncbi:Dipeptidyl peptidase 4 [Balamuthia mandrillaris]
MYVTAVEWVDSITISVTTSNRLQNKQTVLLVNTLTNASRILEVTVSKNGWLEPDSNLKFISINNTVQYFVDTVPDDNGFMQIALYNYSSAELIQTFSAGKKRDVTQILGWYSPTDSLLFVSTASASSAKQDEESFTSLEERAIFSIDDFTKQTEGGKKKREIQDENNWRLLSKVNASSDHPAETEGWWGCSFHEKSGFYVLTFGGNGDVRHVPFTTLHHLHVQDMMVTLESNNDFKANISKLALPTYKFLSIPLQLGENKTSMNAWQLLPPNFQSDKAYPMLLKVYGGPGSQGVTKQYALGFDAYLASQGYVIAAVDGRGTAFRGNDWKFSVYENLGQVESEDQIAAVKFMSKSRYIDSSRLGVWGWSYGGYMTSKILQSNESRDLFTTGIAVAPVTDWSFYDSVYTERYMQTPSLNPSGYQNSSILANPLANFANISFLLVHGTADDNVHLQNSAELSKLLVNKGIAFQQMYYTNNDHSINKDNARRHLYNKLSNFLDIHLRKKEKDQ